MRYESHGKLAFDSDRQLARKWHTQWLAEGSAAHVCREEEVSLATKNLCGVCGKILGT